MVAKLLYLAKRTRPDILLPISFLSTRVHCPVSDDVNKLRRILSYLSGTIDYGIILKPGNQPCLTASIDASYGVHTDGKSHSGFTLSYGDGNILAQSTKQKLVSKSSTESELIALSDKCGYVIWAREFLLSQGIKLGPTLINQDNQSTICLINKGLSTSMRTKHVNIRYFWVKDRIETGELQVVYQPTNDMVADILTKPLQGEQFIALRNKLLNWSC
jgi:hypothetical protein